MTYAVVGTIAWRSFGEREVFRFLDGNATYAADSAWPTAEGRFDDGQRWTLYVSLSAESAVAEFFRRHPELLEFQDKIRLKTFRFVLQVSSPGCDVRTDELATAVGFPFERLRSSERNSSTRYAECRDLADDVEDAAGVWIAFPSAAYGEGENVVVFGSHNDARWSTTGVQSISTPTVDPALVHTVDVE